MSEPSTAPTTSCWAYLSGILERAHNSQAEKIKMMLRTWISIKVEDSIYQSTHCSIYNSASSSVQENSPSIKYCVLHIVKDEILLNPNQKDTTSTDVYLLLYHG